MRTSNQRLLFNDLQPPSPVDTTSTFVDNMKLAIHRWFRFSAGFSAAWVRQVIEHERALGRKDVLDPFSGSGTVLLEAESAGCRGQGVENHPFVARVARAKLRWRESAETLCVHSREILARAKEQRGDCCQYPSLIRKCYPDDVLADLDCLRSAIAQLDPTSAWSDLCWLALVAILRPCSPVGTAQWQYVLPGKSKAHPLPPLQAFEAKVLQMTQDMRARQAHRPGPQPEQHEDDAREMSCVSDKWADLVITSPPYANNFDYADALRLEMSFMGEVRSWGDLRRIRPRLIRACTQHVAEMEPETERILAEPLLAPIQSEMRGICSKLLGEREVHAGRKPYHTMIAAYFSDLARVWKQLRRVTRDGALVCFVIGDSAPYGIHVPVERWLGELALSAGFTSFEFEKTRDRNVKWKNRKHRVPLLEGRLWVRG